MLRDIFRLVRVKQWYKNLLIFLPLIFSINLFNLNLFTLTLLGFISLCLISSSNYIFNDIVDRKKDKYHPEKKNRPIAAGKIDIFSASLIAILLAFASLYLAYTLSLIFMYSVIALFLLTQLYSFYLKNEAFADVLLIAVNFVVRSISGAFIINVEISPWLILCPFFLAMFLAIGKREADSRLLGKNGKNHKAVLEIYTLEITQYLMNISVGLLIISYSLYAVSSNYLRLLITLPFCLYVIMRYYYLVRTGSEIGRHPHKVINDTKIMIALFLWLLSVFISLYLIKIV